MQNETRIFPFCTGRNSDPRTLTAVMFYAAQLFLPALHPFATQLRPTTVLGTQSPIPRRCRREFVLPIDAAFQTLPTAEGIDVSREVITSLGFCSDHMRLADELSIISRNDKHTPRENERSEVYDNAFRDDVAAHRLAAGCTGHAQSVGRGGSSIDQMRRSGLFGTWRIPTCQSQDEV